MTYQNKTASMSSERGGFYPAQIASVDGDAISVIVPQLSSDLAVELAAHVGPIPEVGADIFVSFLNGMADELAAILPGGGGKIEYDFFVAAYNASNGIKAGADYVCDGVNDEVEIQRALDAVVNGDYGYGQYGRAAGRVVLSAGDFYVSSPFEIQFNSVDTFMIEGAGKGATRINAEFDPSEGYVFGTGKTTQCVMKNMSISFQATETATMDFFVISAQSPYYASLRLESVTIRATGLGDSGDTYCNGLLSSPIAVINTEVHVDGNVMNNYLQLLANRSTLGAVTGDISMEPAYGYAGAFAANSKFYSVNGGGLIFGSDYVQSFVYGNDFKTAKPAIRMSNALYGAFINLNTFEGSSPTESIIEIPRGWNFVVTSNSFVSAGGALKTSGTYCNDIVITGNTFAGATNADIDFSSTTDGFNIKISNNTFDTAGDYAIDLGEYEYVEVSNNAIFSSGSGAIRLHRANIFTLSNNAISIPEEEGV